MDTSDPFRTPVGQCPLRVEPVVLRGITGSGLRASVEDAGGEVDCHRNSRERIARWVERPESVCRTGSNPPEGHLRKLCRPASCDRRLLVHIALGFLLGLCLVVHHRLNSLPRGFPNLASWSHLLLQRERDTYEGLRESEFEPGWSSPAALGKLCRRMATEDSAVGLRWEAFLDRQSSEYYALLPRYFSRQNVRAASVLAALGSREAVVRCIRAEWAGWNASTRSRWLDAMLSQTNAAPYADLLLEEMRSPNPKNASLAAALLLQFPGSTVQPYQPLLLEITHREVQDLVPGSRPTRVQRALLDAWVAHPVPDRATKEALIRELHDHSPLYAILILLPMVNTALDSPELGADFRQLASSLDARDQRFVLDWVTRNASRALKLRPWMIDWLGSVASSRQDPRLEQLQVGRMMAGNRQMAIELLESLGARAEAVLPGLFEILESDAKPQVRRSAARAVANIAPPELRWINRAVPLLGRSIDMAPLLVWLAAIGTDALPALPAVQALACNQCTLPDANMGCPRDHLGMVHYTPAPVDRRNCRPGPASKALIHADWACPMSLKEFWPVTEKRDARGVVKFPLKPVVTLDELAVLCYFRLKSDGEEMLPKEPQSGESVQAAAAEMNARPND